MKIINYIFVLLIFGLFISCADDEEICDKPGTPKMTIAFYKNGKKYKIHDTNIGMNYGDNSIDFGNFDNLDSIQIPLPLIKNDLIKGGELHFYSKVPMEGSDSLRKTEDIFKIEYNTSLKYVSKGCGFKHIFKNFSGQLTKEDLFKSIDILTSDIKDESKTNIRINYK